MNSNYRFFDRTLIRLFLRLDTAHDFANSKVGDLVFTRDFINEEIGDNLERDYPILSGGITDSHFETTALEIVKNYNDITKYFLEDDALILNSDITPKMDIIYDELTKTDRNNDLIQSTYQDIGDMLQEPTISISLLKK